MSEISVAELEEAIKWLIPKYDRYCALTGERPNYARIPKYLVTDRKDLPALLKPKEIQS